MCRSLLAKSFPDSCLVQTTLSFILLILAPSVGSSQTELPTVGDPTKGNSRTIPGNIDSGALGGGAVADFGSLMTLITETIEPDAWINGDSSLLPYASGVSVNAQQKIERNVIDRESKRMQHDEEIYISLKGIEQNLADVRSGRRSLSEDICRLGELIRITSVRIDSVNEDIVIGGLRGTQRDGYRLDDLAVIAAVTRREGQEFGCSIDPTDDGIRAVQAFMSASTGVRLLARRPEAALKEIESRLGVQNVRLFGMPEASPLAHALVRADVNMKEVGFGRQQLIVPIKSYFERLDANSSSVESMVRWWFAYSDESIRSNSNGDCFELPERLVVLKSEREWMTAQGRASSGQTDLAADGFAQEFSEKLPEIRKNYPVYDRLSAIYEVALALQLGLDVNGQQNYRAWFPTLVRIGESVRANSQANVPKVDRSLVEHTRLRSGTVVAVVSGGVVVESKRLASSSFRTVDQRLDYSPKPNFVAGEWLVGANPR